MGSEENRPRKMGSLIFIDNDGWQIFPNKNVTEELLLVIYHFKFVLARAVEREDMTFPVQHNH